MNVPGMGMVIHKQQQWGKHDIFVMHVGITVSSGLSMFTLATSYALNASYSPN